MRFLVSVAVPFIFISQTTLAARSLVYMEEKGSEKHIVLATEGGVLTRRMTSGDAWNLYPAISSDGESVAYSESENHQDFAIVTLPVSGGIKERWTPYQGLSLQADFSGDGRRLAFSGPVGLNGLQSVAWIDLGSERSRGPASRSTDQLVYEPQLNVLSADGYPAFFPSLSSDGSQIVFHRQREFRASTQGLQCLLSDVRTGGVTTLPGACPTSMREGIVLRRNDVVLKDVKTGEMRILSEPGIHSMAPSFSWDDRYVAFTEFRNDNWDIVIVDVLNPGTAARRVTKALSRDFSPRFEHDGSLLFASDGTGSFQLNRITAAELETSDPRPTALTSSPNSTAYAPQISGPLAITQEIKAPVLSPARSSFSAVTSGGKIFITGGHQGKEHTYPPESFLNLHEEYNPETNSWRPLKARSLAAHGYESVSYGNYIYVFGGFAFDDKFSRPRWKSLDSIERYDILNDRWEVVGKLLSPRSSNIVAQVGTKVFIMAGWDSTPRREGDTEGKFQREIEVFDLETHEIALHQSTLPDPLRRALSAVVVGDEIMLIGGLGVGSSHFELLDKVTAFNTVTGTFRELPPLPFPTFAPAAGVIDRTLRVFGGMFKVGVMSYKYVNHIYEMPLAGSGWTHSGRYLSETKGFARVLDLGDSNLAIIGGHTYEGSSDHPVATFETFGIKR